MGDLDIILLVEVGLVGVGEVETELAVLNLEIVGSLGEGVLRLLECDLLLYHRCRTFTGRPEGHLDCKSDCMRGVHHLKSRRATIVTIVVLVRQTDRRSICPSRHVDVAFGEFDLLLKELVVEVILDGEVLAQQVEYALR